MTPEAIRERLLKLRDNDYRDFQASLMPTMDKEKIIGVRTPLLRQLAKELLKENDYSEFLSLLPHKYYEEDNLHGFIIEGIKDCDLCIALLRTFIPCIDNWATCDCVRPKVLRKNPDKALLLAREVMGKGDVYCVRYGVGILLSFFLDDNFSPSQLHLVSQIKSDEYYINMMLSWYFATALAKQYEATIPFIEKRLLPLWVHNKTIEKARESLRISPETKEYLKTLKI